MSSKGSWSEPFSGFVHDFSRLLPDRAKQRRTVGPYCIRPSSPGSQITFYMEEGSTLRMDRRGGSPIDLRVARANSAISGTRLARCVGYYGDAFMDDIIEPIIARLPRRRGFLAGWTMGEGMLSTLDRDIHESARDAAFAAHDLAETYAARCREVAEQYDDAT